MELENNIGYSLETEEFFLLDNNDDNRKIINLTSIEQEISQYIDIIESDILNTIINYLASIEYCITYSYHYDSIYVYCSKDPNYSKYLAHLYSTNSSVPDRVERYMILKKSKENVFLL